VIKRKPDAMSSDAFLAAVIGVASAILLPFYLWETGAGRPFPFESEALVTAAYVGVFPTALALLVFNRAVLMLGANRTALFNHLVPVFATLLAIVFLGERLALFHGVGASLIAAGLAVSTVNPGRTEGPRAL
jgi:drug/metabolite transporter (DMT)-like permease